MHPLWFLIGLIQAAGKLGHGVGVSHDYYLSGHYKALMYTCAAWNSLGYLGVFLYAIHTWAEGLTAPLGGRRPPKIYYIRPPKGIFPASNSFLLPFLLFSSLAGFPTQWLPPSSPAFHFFAMCKQTTRPRREMLQLLIMHSQEN